MRRSGILLSGIGLGAAAVYLLDPASGQRRRQRLAEAAAHVTHRAFRTASAMRRDLGNRLRGSLATGWQHAVTAEPDDDVLRERVQTAIGRLLARPHEIAVRVSGGVVLLNGPRLRADELRRIVSAAGRVAGVSRVEFTHDLHTLPANTPLSDEHAVRPRAAVRRMGRRTIAGGLGLLAAFLATLVRQAGGRIHVDVAHRR
jgi:BON domain